MTSDPLLSLYETILGNEGAFTSATEGLIPLISIIITIQESSLRLVVLAPLYNVWLHFVEFVVLCSNGVLLRIFFFFRSDQH